MEEGRIDMEVGRDLMRNLRGRDLEPSSRASRKGCGSPDPHVVRVFFVSLRVASWFELEDQ